MDRRTLFSYVTPLICTALIAVAATDASAGINRFTPVGPDGGEVIEVAYNTTTPNVAYAIAGSGFYRSTNAGATWQLTKEDDFQNAPSDMEVDPSNPARVYLAASGQYPLWASSDSGVTFAPLSSYPGFYSAWQLEISADGNTLYATTGAQLFRSNDRGATWAASTQPVLPANGTVRRLAIDPTNKETLYALAVDGNSVVGLYTTHDGGASWSALPAAAAAGYIFDIAIHPANPNRLWIVGSNGVFVSSNAGANFSFSYAMALANAVQALAINPADPTELYIAGPFGHIVHSINEGASWTDVTDNYAAGQPLSIAFPPQSPGHVLISGMAGLALSTTGGANWSRRDTGIVAGYVQTLSADPAADRIYMSAGGQGVHYLEGGASATNSANYTALRQLVTYPTGVSAGAVLAQSAPFDRVFASLNGRVIRSLDGGATWANTGFPLASGYQALVLASSPANPQVILAGMPSSLSRSADGGDTWASANTGLPADVYVDPIVFSPSDPLVVYTAPKGIAGPPHSGPAPPPSFGVYRSLDAGLTWSAANTGIETLPTIALAVDPQNPAIVYASADSKLWRTTNGGSTWTERPWLALGYGYPTAIAIDPTRPSTLYVSGPQVIARSIDGGDSWEPLNKPDPQNRAGWTTMALLPDPRRPYVLLAGTMRFGARQITIAPDLALELTESPGAVVAVGHANTYRYTAQNLGPFHATGTKITFQIPASLQNVSLDSSSGSCSVVGTTGTCTLDVLRAGLSATINLKATTMSEGAFQLTSNISGDQADSSDSNNTLVQSSTTGPEVDVSVTATGSATVQAGSAVTYTLAVKNAGPNTATGVQLNFQLAANLLAGTATTTAGSCSISGGVVTCSLGNLAASATATVTVNVTMPAAGAMNSQATLSTTAADVVLSNNSAIVTTNVVAAPPSGGGSSGGGGGGSLSLGWLLLLGVMTALSPSLRGSPRLRC